MKIKIQLKLLLLGGIGLVVFTVSSMYILFSGNYRALYSVSPALASATCEYNLYDYGREMSKRECRDFEAFMKTETSSCVDCIKIPVITEQCFAELPAEEQIYLDSVHNDNSIETPNMNESFWYLEDSCYLLK
jgi:hypothetical protein